MASMIAEWERMRFAEEMGKLEDAAEALELCLWEFENDSSEEDLELAKTMAKESADFLRRYIESEEWRAA